MSRCARRAAVVLWAIAGAASAWPVDWSHDVEAGKEKFIRLPKVDWLEVEDPAVVKAEWFPDSNELILTGVKQGRTRVLLGADGKVAAWRVRVGQRPLAGELEAAAARKACPTFRPAPSEDVKLTVTAHDEACRVALFALFQTDAYEARAIELEFDAKVLQAQLKLLQAALEGVLKGKVKARYIGAGLVVEGNLTQAEHRKLLWTILGNTIGRFALDDRTEVEAPPEPPPSPADGGVAKP